jgi:hypothetical protein
VELIGNSECRNECERMDRCVKNFLVPCLVDKFCLFAACLPSI